jgi:hypothetical protein
MGILQMTAPLKKLIKKAAHGQIISRSGLGLRLAGYCRQLVILGPGMPFPLGGIHLNSEAA